jgi:hypothetical protein
MEDYEIAARKHLAQAMAAADRLSSGSGDAKGNKPRSAAEPPMAESDESGLPMGPHGPGCECDPDEADAVLPLAVMMAMLRAAALASARQMFAQALASGEPIGIPMQIGDEHPFLAVVPVCHKPWLN